MRIWSALSPITSPPSLTFRSASQVSASASPPLLERNGRATRAKRCTGDSRTARRQQPRARYRAAGGGSKRTRPELASMVPDRRSADAAGSPTPDSCRREARGSGGVISMATSKRCDAAELVLPLALDRLWTLFAIPGRDTAITAVHTALSARGYTPKNVSFAGLMRTTNARHVLRSMHESAGPPSDRRMSAICRVLL